MKTILLTGKTELITTQILEQISRRFSIVITSQEKDRQEDKGRVYHIKTGSTSFEQLFWAYDFSAVWYFSPYCDGGENQDEFSELEAVCDQCRENSVKRLLVVSSSLLSPEQRGKEEEILFSMKKTGIQSVLLRLPGILVDGNEKNSLGKLFGQIYHREKKIVLPDIKDGNYEFLPMRDLISLMKRITISAQEEGIYQLPGEYVISKEEIRKEISDLNKKIKIEFDDRTVITADSEMINILARKYSYQVRDQKPLEFKKLYEEYVEKEKQKKGGIAAWMTRQRSRIPKQLVKVIDIVVLFVLAEYLSQFTSDFIWFREIDVRLIYIFLIATFHGLNAGVLAALAECVMLFFAYQSLGVYGLQLFYNVENWIPFVLCIVTGAITGYFSDLKDNERKLIDKENALLREKYLFLNDMYNVSSEVRDEYRRQILSFDNSYGKIYDAVERMNRSSVAEVCLEAKNILEQLLENHAVAIYQWQEAENRAEYMEISGESPDPDRYILEPGEMKEMFSRIKEGKLFRNTQLVSSLPMYAMGIKAEGDGTGHDHYDPLIIAIWEALPEQMNDYYSNQFEILCGLIGNALEHAALKEKANNQRQI